MAVPIQKSMKYVRLGKSGLKVSKIILGCMSYGTKEWQPWVLEEEDGLKHIKAAYDAGINTFDTANVYSNGVSEVILGKAIKEYNLPRDELVIMTKVNFLVNRTHAEKYIGTDKNPEDYGYVNQRGLSRKHIFESVRHSLDRLGLEYIDLLQCHRFDPNTPIEETMHALHDVVQNGWVRYVGMSSCYAWQFQLMQNYAINNRLSPFISMQNCYSLLYREEEREMMPMLSHFGVGSIPWSPLAGGACARPLSKAKDTVRGSTSPFTAALTGEGSGGAAILETLENIAKEKRKSMAQVALAWVMAKDPVSAPIVGTTSLANLTDLLGALDVEFSGEEMKQLEDPYKPMKVFGH